MCYGCSRKVRNINSVTHRPRDPIVPSDADAAFAREAARLLAASLPDDNGAVHLRLEEPNAPAEAIAVPAAALRGLVSILQGMAKGNAVHVLEHHPEVTTGEMAKLLNVSTPYAIRMLDEGKIPSRLVGTHRRARLADVLTYRDEQYQARKAILDQMAAIDQELGLT
jgi:excisionase family DNA binding protein